MKRKGKEVQVSKTPQSHFFVENYGQTGHTIASVAFGIRIALTSQSPRAATGITCGPVVNFDTTTDLTVHVFVGFLHYRLSRVCVEGIEIRKRQRVCKNDSQNLPLVLVTLTAFATITTVPHAMC